tara:strand:- start:111 stop:578 length:468 start_codon:yes stop_codon:yes gene_type:complete
MKLRNIFIISLLIILNSCGFKAVNQNYFKDYRLIETNVTGDSRISYLIKNHLKFGDKNSKKSIKLDIDTTNIKQISERNIQNEITKYNISINAKINFYFVEDGISGEFQISKGENYDVSDSYSTTLTREKSVIKNLVKHISDQVIKNLQIKLNEF